MAGTEGQPAQADGTPETAKEALERAERTLAEVSAALNRLDDDTFGRCEICGGTISDERLAALPTTSRCAGCAGPPEP
jgi:RNA polymerase-binding transcription factor DksA